MGSGKDSAETKTTNRYCVTGSPNGYTFAAQMLVGDVDNDPMGDHEYSVATDSTGQHSWTVTNGKLNAINIDFQLILGTQNGQTGAHFQVGTSGWIVDTSVSMGVVTKIVYEAYVNSPANCIFSCALTNLKINDVQVNTSATSSDPCVVSRSWNMFRFEKGPHDHDEHGDHDDWLETMLFQRKAVEDVGIDTNTENLNLTGKITMISGSDVYRPIPLLDDIIGRIYLFVSPAMAASKRATP